MSRVGTFYVTPEAPAELLPLLRDGVRPACVSAAEYHGLWTPLHTDTHVYRPRSATQEAHDLDRVLHGTGLRSWPDLLPVADLPLAFEQAARCLPVRDAAILIESALHLRKISLHRARQIVAGLPPRLAMPLDRIDPRAESGTETAVRWWLESLRVAVTPQVWIPEVGRVDLKLGTSWIIECDSATYHDIPTQYQQDRQRDLLLRARGYTVTRLTWEQVFLDWKTTSQLLLACLRRRDHRRPLPR